MSSQPRVDIIILNYNGLDDSIECIESIDRSDYPNLHVILVDNGSKGDDADVIEKRFPDVIVVRNERNLGFGGGMNVGIGRSLESDGQYLLVSNNDVVYEPDAITRMVEEFQKDPSTGVVVPNVQYFHETARKEATHIAGIIHDSIWDRDVKVEMPYEWFTAKETEKLIQSSGAVHFMTGAAFLVSREVIEKVGTFDEDYFLYCEDIDLGYRIHKAGFTIQYASDAVVLHKEFGSFEGNPLNPVTSYHIIYSKFVFGKKHGRPAARLMVLLFAIKYSMYLFLRNRRIDFPIHRSLARGLWDGLKYYVG